mmetsp:Transcript_16790/g.41288  ORF Transcript_16790/g.41288 Transcript_16790/m.41288 type:complete len:656 (-) Transcript_16790:334-2301(-)
MAAVPSGRVPARGALGAHATSGGAVPLDDLPAYGGLGAVGSGHGALVPAAQLLECLIVVLAAGRGRRGARAALVRLVILEEGGHGDGLGVRGLHDLCPGAVAPGNESLVPPRREVEHVRQRLEARDRPVHRAHCGRVAHVHVPEDELHLLHLCAGPVVVEAVEEAEDGGAVGEAELGGQTHGDVAHGEARGKDEAEKSCHYEEAHRVAHEELGPVLVDQHLQRAHTLALLGRARLAVEAEHTRDAIDLVVSELEAGAAVEAARSGTLGVENEAGGKEGHLEEVDHDNAQGGGHAKVRERWEVDEVASEEGHGGGDGGDGDSGPRARERVGQALVDGVVAGRGLEGHDDDDHVVHRDAEEREAHDGGDGLEGDAEEAGDAEARGHGEGGAHSAGGAEEHARLATVRRSAAEGNAHVDGDEGEGEAHEVGVIANKALRLELVEVGGPVGHLEGLIRGGAGAHLDEEKVAERLLPGLEHVVALVLGLVGPRVEEVLDLHGLYLARLRAKVRAVVVDGLADGARHVLVALNLGALIPPQLQWTRHDALVVVQHAHEAPVADVVVGNEAVAKGDAHAHHLLVEVEHGQHARLVVEGLPVLALEDEDARLRRRAEITLELPGVPGHEVLLGDVQLMRPRLERNLHQARRQREGDQKGAHKH